MTAYNLVNGVHCSEHGPLVVDLLKGKWGFSGLVMSDWVSVYSAVGAANNGLDEILIEELELGVRSYNCLKRAGVQTVGDLVRKTRSELNAIPNFGSKSIDEVVETLQARGLDLSQE